MLGGQRRLAVVLRLVAEVDGFVAHVEASLDFTNCQIEIPKRNCGNRNQTSRVGAAPVGEEIVVGTHALCNKFTIAETKEVPVAESTHVGIEDLRVHAFFIKERQTRFCVEHCWMNVVERLRRTDRHDAVEAGH